MKTQWSKIFGMQQVGCEREVYNNTGLHQKAKKKNKTKNSNKQCKLTPKGTRKRTTNLKTAEEIIKINTKINEIETTNQKKKKDQ